MNGWELLLWMLAGVGVGALLHPAIIWILDRWKRRGWGVAGHCLVCHGPLLTKAGWTKYCGTCEVQNADQMRVGDPCGPDEELTPAEREAFDKWAAKILKGHE